MSYYVTQLKVKQQYLYNLSVLSCFKPTNRKKGAFIYTVISLVKCDKWHELLDSDNCLLIALTKTEWFDLHFLTNNSMEDIKIEALFKLSLKLNGSIHDIPDLLIRLAFIKLLINAITLN